MLPQFPPVAPQPRLPSPAASCRRLSTAAFSASAYISAAASDPPRPILRFPRPPAGCPSPLLLPPCPPTCPNPLLPSLSPCDRLSLPVPRLFLSRRVLMLPQFPPVAPQPRLPSPAASCRRLSTAAFPALLLIAALSCLPPVYSSVSPLLPQFPPPDLYCRFPHPPPLSDNFPLSVPAGRLPCLSPGCFSPAVSSCFRSFRPLPLNRVFLLPQRPAAASQPPLSSLRRPFRRSFSLSDKLFTIKKDVPKARLFLQAFFYSLHSSSAAKTSGLQPNTSCQIPRILRPHQTSVRINMRLPENIICR